MDRFKKLGQITQTFKIDDGAEGKLRGKVIAEIMDADGEPCEELSIRRII